MEARLAALKSRIAALQDRLKSAQEEVEAEFAKRIEQSHGLGKAERRKLQELKDAGLKEWEALAEHAEKTWGELEEALAEIASRLKR